MEDQADGEITVSMVPESEQITIRFTDNGCGMTPEVQEQIFEPFFTTKERGKGAGIGMGIVSDIVEKHNGKISCESERDEGSSFIITLPLDKRIS